MQFKVPQFIDVEDKIFGPFTFRQFAYLAGGGGLVYLCLKLLPLMFGILLAMPIAAFALALTFMKINDKPFIDTVQAFIKYHSHSRLYLWKKQESKTMQRPADITITPQARALDKSNLQTLSWSLDVIDTKK